MKKTNSVILSRDMADDPLWMSGKFDHGKKWVDLLLRMNHDDGSYKYWDRKVAVDAGSVALVYRMTAKRWRCKESEVKNYLMTLEMVGLVSQRKHQGCSVVSIIGYEKFLPKGVS